MTGRKPLAVRVRERAWAIHRRWCQDHPCPGPTQDDREQATTEVMRSDSASVPRFTPPEPPIPTRFTR